MRYLPLAVNGAEGASLARGESTAIVGIRNVVRMADLGVEVVDHDRHPDQSCHRDHGGYQQADASAGLIRSGRPGLLWCGPRRCRPGLFRRRGRRLRPRDFDRRDGRRRRFGLGCQPELPAGRRGWPTRIGLPIRCGSPAERDRPIRRRVETCVRQMNRPLMSPDPNCRCDLGTVDRFPPVSGFTPSRFIRSTDTVCGPARRSE
ncbi:hypothetical protein M2432_003897 [Mycobacterium sp. OTB74]|jgi:hypothetical protein|nr:hypothetical protein [Mycobacterium sp. OTB74]